jgi:hypothetical protein
MEEKVIMKRRFVILVAFCLGAGLAGCEEGGDITVDQVEPAVGAMQGDQPVKIHGSHFRTDIGYTVYFGKRKAKQVTVIDSETLVAVAPEAESAGPVDIQIHADNGPAWKVASAYQYQDQGGSVVEQLGEGQEKGSLKY